MTVARVVWWVTLLALLGTPAASNARQPMSGMLHQSQSDDYSPARLRPAGSFGSTNGGWCYDAYPDLKPLNAGARICIADIEGPAVITHIHSTAHAGLYIGSDRAALVARGVMLEIEFDDSPQLSVRVPLGDFFGDGNGAGACFTSLTIERAPNSYNCFIPMPFAKRARVWLRNETAHNLGNYSFVEFTRLETWDPGLGYFHATWKRSAFPLHLGTDEPFFHVDGRGQLLGTSWTITTDAPLFRDMTFVMEGNVEVRADGGEAPVADYLGSEDSFGFSWGFQKPFAGLRNGITFVRPRDPAQVTAYRFRDRNMIPFARSLDVRVDWTHEARDNEPLRAQLRDAHASGGGWVDYATVWYWYQDRPGYDHGELLPCEERAKLVLHPCAAGKDGGLESP